MPEPEPQKGRELREGKGREGRVMIEWENENH